jgi:hypothetical protein
VKSDAGISNLHGLRWTLALGHGAVVEVWWGWVCLCVATGGGALVWWWRRGTVRPGGDRLREALPPVGLMLLGGLMLLLPVWRGLDRWLDDVDAALLWAFLSDGSAVVVPVSVPATTLSVCGAPVTDGLPGQCPAPCRVDGAGRCASWPAP